MKRIFIVTACSPKGLPQQGSLIAERLAAQDVDVRVVGKAQSGWGRLLVVIFFSVFVLPRYDTALINVFALRAFVFESFAILYAYLWRKRVVVVLRSGFMREFVERWPRWSRFVLSRADLILVPHEFLRKELSKIGLRIDGVISNFIDTKKYRFRERSIVTPRFLYLRGTHPFYNAPMALRAFAIIQEKYPHAELTIAGKDGEEAGYCRSLVATLKLRNVHFLGMVPKESIPELADRHDIHLHSNRVDNMPVTIIEMWACGLPIVGTNIGGMPYLVRNGVDGILVDLDDHEAMANACLALLSDATLAQKLSRNGRARAEQFTWQRVKSMWQGALAMRETVLPEAVTNDLDVPAEEIPDGTEG
jgi:glycosyltransferase involved in cell wall biosynthesis